MDAARAGERRRRTRLLPQAAIIGFAAAVTAVALTASLLADRDDAPRTLSAPADLTDADLRHMTAAEVLERAAQAVEEQPAVTEPEAEQWVYTKVAQEGRALESLEALPLGERYQETWLRYDGRDIAFKERGPSGTTDKLQVNVLKMEQIGTMAVRSPRQTYRFLSTLPADAEGALKALRARDVIVDTEGATRSQEDYAEIAYLLGADIMPRKALAGLYRALATVPGLTVVDHLVEDAAGHRAVAVRYGGNVRDDDGNYISDGRGDSGDSGGQYDGTEWLIDPRTYDVLGMRLISDGRVDAGGSTVRVAVVDKPGERD
ncbi:CU044_5270 family protein [Streptomyces sp. NPDC002643]